MNLKRAISAFAALAMSVSCFVGLAVTTNADDGDTIVNMIGSETEAETFDDYAANADKHWTSTGTWTTPLGNGAQWGVVDAPSDATKVSGKFLCVRYRGRSTTSATYTADKPVANGNVYFETDYYANATPTTTVMNSDTIYLQNSDGVNIVAVTWITPGNDNAAAVKVTGSGSAENADKIKNATTTFKRGDHPHEMHLAIKADLDAHTATVTINGADTVTVAIDENANITKLYFDATGGANSTNFDAGIDNTKFYAKTTEVKMEKYTIKYVCNGTEVKTAREPEGVVGAPATVNADDTKDFILEDKTKKYIYVSDDSEGKTVAEDGSTVITVTLKEAAVYKVKAVASTDATVEFMPETDVFERESIKYSYPKYLTNAEGKVVASTAEGDFIKTVTPTKDETIEVPYTAYEGDAWFAEAETLFADSRNDDSVKYSGGTARRDIQDEAGKQVMTVPEDGIYSVTYVSAGNNTNKDEAGISQSRYMTMYLNSVADANKIGEKTELTGSRNYPITTKVDNVKLKKDDKLLIVADNGQGILDYVLIEKLAPNIIKDVTSTTSKLTAEQIAALTAVGTAPAESGITADTDITTYTIKVFNYDGTSKPTLVIVDGDEETELTPSGTDAEGEDITYGYQDGDNFVFVIQTVGYGKAARVTIGTQTYTFPAAETPTTPAE